MKGDKVHKLYGSKPSNYRLSVSYITGTEEGSADSAVVFNDTVIYNGADGVYAYTGGEPEYLSEKTGRLGSDAARRLHARRLLYSRDPGRKAQALHL